MLVLNYVTPVRLLVRRHNIYKFIHVIEKGLENCLHNKGLEVISIHDVLSRVFLQKQYNDFRISPDSLIHGASCLLELGGKCPHLQ